MEFGALLRFRNKFIYQGNIMNVQIYLMNQIHTIIHLLKNNTRGHTMKIIAKN